MKRISATVLALGLLSGCAGLSDQEQRLLTGGAGGAAAGAIIGGIAGDATLGAAIGGGVGLLGGYAVDRYKR